MITPIRRNVMVEITDDESTYSSSNILKPNSYRGISGKMILKSKAYNCHNSIPLGAEVILEYPTDEVERNLLEIDGGRYFIVRETFVAGWFDGGG